MTLYVVADRLSDAINPLLVLAIAVEPLLGERAGRWRRSGVFWVRALVGIGIAVGLAEWGKAATIWAGHPGFPSGHTAFATAASAALGLQRGRYWWLIGALAVGLMAVSLVYGGWHTLTDTLGAIVLGLAITLPLWQLSHRLSRLM